ncbi:MAG: PAS domain S-box protein [Promethearchaeota archaeon]|nr:MAG: PAS domain S-box protein [Candidatus Lokiarchaeota archaeon]
MAKGLNEEIKKKNSEKRFRIILENANDLITIINERSEYEYLNETAHLKILGYNREELMSKPALEFVHPDDREKAVIELKKAFEIGETSVELRLKSKSGSYVWVDAKSKSFIDQDGKRKLLGIARDITDNKKIENALKESEEKYKNLFKSIPDGIVTTSMDGKILSANQAYLNMLGYSLDELKNMNFQLITPEKWREAEAEAMKSFMPEGYGTFEKEYIRKDGSIIPISLTTWLIKDEQGNPIKIAGFVEDITERKKAEQNLRESKEKYRTFFDDCPVALWEEDWSELKTYIDNLKNSGTYNFRNYFESHLNEFRNSLSMIKIVNINKETLKMFKCHDKNEFIENLPKILTETAFNVYREGFIAIIEGETNFVSENVNNTLKGDIIYTVISVNVVPGYEETLKRILVSLTDITDKKKAEQKLKESEEKYRNIIENTMEGYFEVDLKGNFTYFNEALCEMSGYTKEEAKGTSFSTYMTEEDSRKTFNVFNKVYNTGIPEKNFQYEFFRKNGKKVYGESSVYLRYDSEGNKIGFSGFLRDVTEKQETEQNLKESEEKFRTITEQSLMGILILQDDVVKYVNKQYTELVGYETEEIKSWQPGEFFKIMHPEDRDMIMRHAELRQKGLKDEINHYFHRVIKKTGEIVWCEIFAKTINYKGRPADLITVVDKTDVKEAEEKLKESEEKFRTITEQSLMGVTIIQDNKVQYINQQFAELSGYTIDEAKSLQLKEIYEVIHPEDRKMVMEQFMKKQEGSQDVTNHYQYRIIKKTREIVWLDNFSKTINFMGRPADLVTVIDITERKLAEERLKESQEKYKNMINDLDLGFFQAKWDGTILNVNPAFRMIMGYSQSEDLIGKKISFFFKNPEDQKKYSEELLKNNIVDNYIIHGKNLYGEELILQTDSHLKRDEKGNPIEIEGTLVDITEKFKLEQKLKLSEERYRFLFENSPLAIILSDFNGVIREINPATEKLIGYSKKEVIGRSYLNLSIIHPDDLPIIQQRFRQYIKGETAPPIDVKFYRKDGSLLWANINSNIIKIGNETFLHVMCQDVTERKKAELLVKEEIEKLKELDQIRKDLISRVSHELKTPLIPVLGGVEYLLYSYSDKFEKEQIELLEMIQKGGKRLGKLVERLLDITRIEYDKLILNRQLTNLSEIIKETANDMKYLIKDRKINLNLVVPEDLFLEIDGMRMEQVITNLLSNALKNTPPNGRVSLGLEKYGNWAIISVSDTGVGFTEDEMKKIFTKFGKIERQGEGLEYINMEGSGLGLFITKQIVDLHGGKIWVESTGRNRGCIFKVRLPII